MSHFDIIVLFLLHPCYKSLDIMKYRIGVLFFIITCLLSGTLIYAFARPGTIYLNQWLDHIVGDNFQQYLSAMISGFDIPGWIIYSLPDALWMMALITLILFIWDFKINSKSIPWIFSAFITGILIEIFQVFHLIRGTFDRNDLLFMIVAACIPLSFTLKNQVKCKTM